MAVTGVIHPDRVIRNVGVSEGDALVLTKPLGTGIVTTALKQRKASRGERARGGRVDGRAEPGRRRSVAARASRCTPAPTSPASVCSATRTEMAMGSGVTLVLGVDGAAAAAWRPAAGDGAVS